jgi:hypothetical protein
MSQDLPVLEKLLLPPLDADATAYGLKKGTSPEPPFQSRSALLLWLILALDVLIRALGVVDLALGILIRALGVVISESGPCEYTQCDRRRDRRYCDTD